MICKILKNSALLLLVCGFLSCSDAAEEAGNVDFDRDALLAFYADEMIVPGYNSLHEKAVALKNSLDLFVEAPSENRLQEAQNQWVAAFSEWQNVNLFNFGPAENSVGTLDQDIALFPVNVALVESRIADGYFLTDDFNRDTRGFLGIEYLIFGESNTQQTVVAQFTGTQGANRRAYLQAIAGHLVAQLNSVKSDWNDYRSVFLVNNGTDAGSSVSQMYNQFLRSFEALKNYKIGLPAGKRTPQIQPEKVEALYSGKSLEMAKIHLGSLESFFRGRKANGQFGLGFEAYVNAALNGDTSLTSETLSQLAKAKQALDAIPPGKLSVLVQSHPQEVGNAFDELQKLTRYLKSDIASQLNISINYESGDGD